MDKEHIIGRKSVVSLDVESLKREAGLCQCYLCASAGLCAHTCEHVLTPECVYLTCPGIRNLCHSLVCRALTVTARWDTAGRLLFHTVLY